MTQAYQISPPDSNTNIQESEASLFNSEPKNQDSDGSIKTPLTKPSTPPHSDALSDNPNDSKDNSLTKHLDSVKSNTLSNHSENQSIISNSVSVHSDVQNLNSDVQNLNSDVQNLNSEDLSDHPDKKSLTSEHSSDQTQQLHSDAISEHPQTKLSSSRSSNQSPHELSPREQNVSIQSEHTGEKESENIFENSVKNANHDESEVLITKLDIAQPNISPKSGRSQQEQPNSSYNLYDKFEEAELEEATQKIHKVQNYPS